MTYVAGALVAFFATLVLIPQLVRVSDRLGLVDHPAHRKVHARPIPVCGGIAMVCGACAALVLCGVHLHALLPYCVGAFLLVAIGVIDDIRDVGYRWRLFWQVAAALIVALGGTTLQNLPFFGPPGPPTWLAVVLSVLFIVAVTNAVNLLDGLDGLAGGCVLLSLLAIGLVGGHGETQDATLLAAVVAAAILAFLRHNTHPAAVFMGDAGSTFLGFTLAVVALMTIDARPPGFSVFALLPLIGLPLVDTAKVFCERLILGRSPFAADRRHLHHRLLSAGLRHKDVVTTCYLIQGAMVFTAALLHDRGHLHLAIFSVVAALSVIVAVEGVARSGIVARRQTAAWERRNLWLRRWRWLPKASRLAVGYAIAAYLVVGAALPGSVPADLAAMAVMLAVLLLFEQRLAAVGLALPLRIGVSATVVLIGCLVISEPLAASPLARAAIPGFAGVLAALLALAMRVTRREIFPISPQDILVGIVVLGTMAAIAAGLIDHWLAGPAIALVALLYGCEYLSAEHRTPALVLRHAAIASLLIVAGRGVLA